MHSLQETIRPSADLRNHYNEISRQCREENKAVIISQWAWRYRLFVI